MNLLRAFIFTILVVSGTVDGYSQIQKRPLPKNDKSKVSEENTLEKYTADIKLGNLGFFRNLYLSSKLNAGYKITDYFSAGVGVKAFYTQIFVPGIPDDKFFDIGGFVYGRAKIFNNFFVQGEYHYTSFDYINSRYPGANIYYPSVGAGYASGAGNWNFGLELNFNLNELTRDYQGSVVEYWVGAFYNF
jgi:hypothetical protein